MQYSLQDFSCKILSKGLLRIDVANSYYSLYHHTNMNTNLCFINFTMIVKIHKLRYMSYRMKTPGY